MDRRTWSSLSRRHPGDARAPGGPRDGFKGPIRTPRRTTRSSPRRRTGGSVYVQFGAFETADTVPGVKKMATDLEAADAPLDVLGRRRLALGRHVHQALKKTGKNLTVETFQKAASKLKYNVDQHRRSHDLPQGPRAARRVRDIPRIRADNHQRHQCAHNQASRRRVQAAGSRDVHSISIADYFRT